MRPRNWRESATLDSVTTPRNTLAGCIALLLATGCSAPRLAPDPPSAPSPRAQPADIIVERSPLPEPPIPTPREDTSYELHGVTIADPYQWLEDGASPRVAAWTAAQNRLTESTLAAIPEREHLRRRLRELVAIDDISIPRLRRLKSGAVRYFHTVRRGSQKQPVLLARDGVGGSDVVLVDPNRNDATGTAALDWYAPSQDGALVAYGISHGGTEESTLRVLEVTTGRHLPDRISRTRHCSVCWKGDGGGFFYSRLVAPGTVPAGQENYHRLIYEHDLGRDPDLDPVVFGEGRRHTEYPGCLISPNGRWLLVQIHDGWNRTGLFLADTTQPERRFVDLTRGRPYLYDALVRDDAIYVNTNEGAALGALYRASPESPGHDTWQRLIVEHSQDVLDSYNVVGSQIWVTYLHEGASRVERFDEHGRSLGEFPLPALGSSGWTSGLPDGNEVFLDFQSFVHAPRVLRVDLEDDSVSTWNAVPAVVDPDDYAIERRHARSPDGTRIPYLVVRRAAAPRSDPGPPTLLYGYGGFGLSLLPRFSRPGLAWLERGGVFVQANLRGGGEFGEPWHRAGQLDQKQNVFDDYLAVARDLISTGLTRPERLAAYGRSNGGLLVAAALTQRPDLFRAAVAAVPLTDMLRYQRSLLGRLWVPEYGSAEDPEPFEWLRAYSPYHRVEPGRPYPAVLLLTAAGDTRVDPSHARKLTAALQYASTSNYPILLRTELQAGHGVGKPTSKIVDEYADLYAFLLWQLGEARRTSYPGNLPPGPK
jgi:prolyl oligopeptidase